MDAVDARREPCPPGHLLLIYASGERAVRLGAATRRAIPGADEPRTFVDTTAFRAIAGGLPDLLASDEAARLLAMAAYVKARNRSASGRATGLGIASGPIGDGGMYGLYLAVQTIEATVIIESEFQDRPETADLEQLAAALAVRALTGEPGCEPTHPDATIRHEAARAGPALVRLLHDEAPYAVEPDGEAPETPRVLFPGSFRPYHEGHALMARVAARMLGQPVHFELAVRNVDKPPLDYRAIRGRVAGLLDRAEPHHGRVWLTRASTFAEKAALFPGPLVFVVGLDTLERVGSPRYYECVAAMEQTIAELAEVRGCRFLAFPRGQTGDLDRLPATLRAITTFVPVEEVRSILHVASRDLRQRGDRTP